MKVEQLLAAIVLALGMGFFLIWQHVTFVRTAYKARQLQQRLDQLNKQTKEQASAIDAQKSPPVMLGKFQKLGYGLAGEFRWAYTDQKTSAYVAEHQDRRRTGRRRRL